MSKYSVCHKNVEKKFKNVQKLGQILKKLKIKKKLVDGLYKKLNWIFQLKSGYFTMI